MAELLVCGAECDSSDQGSTSLLGEANPHWSNLTGATPMSRSTTTVRSGSRSFTCPSGSTTIENVHKTAAQLYAGRFYIRFSALPDVNCNLSSFENVANAALEYVQATGKLRWKIDGGATGGEANVVLAVDTWYCVRFSADFSAATWVFELSVDGVAATQFTSAQSAFAPSHWKLGRNCGGTSSATATIFYDDIRLTDTATNHPLPATNGIKGYLPNGTGTNSFNATGDFQKGTIGALVNAAAADTDLHTYVDDLPGSPGTDVLAVAAAASGEYVELTYPDETVETGEVQAAQLVLAVRAAGTAACKLSIRYHDGTTEHVGIADKDVSETTTFRMAVNLPNINTLAEWNAFRTRVGSSWGTVGVNPVPYLVAEMAEVEWAVPAASGRRPQPPLVIRPDRRRRAVVRPILFRTRSQPAADTTLAAALSATVSQAGALSTAITAATALSASASAAPALATAITAATAMAATGAIAAPLSTAITAATALSAVGTLVAPLATSITATTSLNGTASFTGQLTTAIQLAAVTTAQATLVADLQTTQSAARRASVLVLDARTRSRRRRPGDPPTILAAYQSSSTPTLAAALTATASVTPALTNAIRLAAATSATATLGPPLTTAIQLAADRSGTATLSGALATAIQLAATPQATATLSPALASASELAAVLAASTALAPAVTTGITLATAGAAAATLSPSIAAQIRFAAALSGSATIAADLFAPGSLVILGELLGTLRLASVLGGEISTLSVLDADARTSPVLD